MAIIRQQGMRITRDKLGEVTITVPFVCDTEEEVLQAGPARMLGLPEEDRDGQQIVGGPGRYRVMVTYKGTINVPSADQEVWDGEISLREDPIQSHPRFAEMKAEFGWEPLTESGEYGFPEEVPETSRRGQRGFKKSGEATNRKSPMFGVKTYPVQIGEVTHEYIRLRLPVDLYSRVGRVLDNLPGNSGIPTPDGYKWIQMNPKFRRSGDGFRIIDRYQLVPDANYLTIVSQVISR